MYTVKWEILEILRPRLIKRMEIPAWASLERLPEVIQMIQFKQRRLFTVYQINLSSFCKWSLWTLEIIKEKIMWWFPWTDHTIHYMKKSFLQHILFQETPPELMKLIEVMPFTRNRNLHQISQNVRGWLSFGLLYLLLPGGVFKSHAC